MDIVPETQAPLLAIFGVCPLMLFPLNEVSNQSQ